MQIPVRPRAMADATVRRARAAQSAEPHINPINRLVDEIGRDPGIPNLPYVDPTFGGVNATVLMILKAPEADSNPDIHGRRFLSLDNNDEGAERMFETCGALGLDRNQLVAWNICPFPIAGDRLTVAELRAATPYNRRLLAMLPSLKAVVLLGNPAKEGWRKSRLRGPQSCAVFEGASPSPPGIRKPQNRNAYETAMAGAAEAVRGQ